MKFRHAAIANTISILSLWSVRHILRIGQSRAIDENEIYALKHGLQSERSTGNLSAQWRQELNKTAPSLFKALYNMYGARILCWCAVVTIIETVSKILLTSCIGGLVSFFSTGQTSISRSTAFWYASGIVLSMLLFLIAFHPIKVWLYEVAAKYRISCAGLIYQKTLTLSKAQADDGLNGSIFNILGNDMMHFEYGLASFANIFKGPLEVLVLGYIIYTEVGLSGIIGMLFMVAFVPVQVWIGKKAAEIRLKIAKRTDIRVRMTNEIILGIQVIKMYAWENLFANLMENLRREETKAIRSAAYIRATITSFVMIAKVSLFLSLASHVYFGNVITARKVFMVSSLFQHLNWSMVFFWPIALTRVAELHITIRRIQEYLLQPEGCPVASEQVIQTTAVANAGEVGIKLSDASASWKPTGGISGINLIVGPNSLCGVVGQVGSGKSTLLNVILGELRLDGGCKEVNGTLAYTSQEPWLFEDTIRNNIIFVENFDETRYQEVVHVCALERDFQLLAMGDQTKVGERGVKLSGGQKARINLARAIYKQADIYLLDDPLSAVDTHVGKHIFDKCVMGYLKDKCRILVTHQLQYLQGLDLVVIMKDGRIEAQGSYPQLCTHETFVSLHCLSRAGEMTKEYETEAPSSTHEVSGCDSPNLANAELSANEDSKENQAIGSITLEVYKTFLTAVNGFWFAVFIGVLFVVAQLSVSGVDFFVSQWVNWEERVAVAQNITSSNDNIIAERDMLMASYTALMVFTVAIYLYRTISFFQFCLRAATGLHKQMFRGVSGAKMQFFHMNSSGRILNRFTKDMGNIDSALPGAVCDFLGIMLSLFVVVIIFAIVNAWLLIPAVIMVAVLLIIRKYYLKPARSLKRIDAINNSPVYAHVNASLQGLPIIRAFQAERFVEKQFHKLQDRQISAGFSYSCTTKGFALWLDVICLVYVASVVYSLLIFRFDMGSGDVGLVIMTSIGLIRSCQYAILQSAEIENQMTSIERILEYIKLPNEKSLRTGAENTSPDTWPSSGRISFRDLSLRYTERSSRVLNNWTMDINASEKIGVVGRTGAGKSSIVQALFRLAHNEGQILVDDVDIAALDLHELRRKMSIIPQDPVLFSGTLRFNLDPFQEKSEADLWNALEQVELKDVVASLNDGLDCKMLDGGSNFSMGQRQLVCLARAILRNSKILILDEATANVDPETDRLLQNTIRNAFSGSTVLTIAHRLHTVMDYDRVLVVDAGEIVEFDHPYELVQKPDGFFRNLVDQTDSTTALALIQSAKENYEKSMKSD